MVRRQLARRGLAALLALAMAAPAAAAPPQSPAPEADGTLWESGDELAPSFSLSPAGLELEVGSSAALALRASPAGAQLPPVTWSSGDERVAVVDDRGMVTAVGEGQTVVTAAAVDGGLSARCVVTVTWPGGPAKTYPPVVEKTAGGTTSVFPARPEEGSVVTISAVPQTGHEVASVSAVSGDGQAVPVRRHQDGTWAFRQPDSQVTVTVTFRRKPWTSPFADVRQGAWYYDSVALVCQEGLMRGTGQGFQPGATVTRGTLATILARLDGADTDGGGTWYEKGMAWAVAAGVSDGTAPEQAVTREQAAVMLYRYAGRPAVSGGKLAAFPDGGQVSRWAVRGMGWAVEQGLIQGGDRGLDPQGTATRAELAAMLSRFLTLQ